MSVLMSGSDGMTMLHRRDVIAGAGAVPLLTALPAEVAGAGTPSGSLDERHWRGVAAQYDRPSGVIQLEHGNWGAMARPVREAFVRHVERVNRDTSYYARRSMGGDLQAAHGAVATLLGVDPTELLLTRNATEALRALILGYRKLQPGDTVVYADHDYDSMQHCMMALAARRKVQVVRLALPEGASQDALRDAYAAAFRTYPRVRLVLLTHLGHRTGIVLPVAEISDLARAYGADVIVDAAHSLGQLDFKAPDLRADFVGVNLHKWIGAPLGIGAMIVRTGRTADIEPDPAADLEADQGIRALVHTGTTDFAAALTLPDALRFLDIAGPLSARVARLRALRDRWVQPLRAMPGISILTNDEPGACGAITAFRLNGDTSEAGNRVLVTRLLETFGIFTVVRTGLSGGACVRVTPSLASSMSDLDHLVRALGQLASHI